MSCANAAVAIRPMEQQRHSRLNSRSAVGRTMRFAEEEGRDGGDREVSRLTFPPEARRVPWPAPFAYTRARGMRATLALAALAQLARGFEESEGAEYAVGPNGEMHQVVGNPYDCDGIDMSEFCNPDAPRRPPGPCCASDTLVVKKEFFHCRAPLHFSDQDKTFSRHGGAYHWDIQPEAARFFRDPGSGLWYFGYQSNKGDGRRTHVALANVTCPTEADWVRTGECSDDNSPFVRPVACAPLDVHYVEIGKPGPYQFPEPPGWARPYVDEDGTVRIPAGHEEHDDDELYGDVLETYVDDHQGDIDWLDARE